MTATTASRPTRKKIDLTDLRKKAAKIRRHLADAEYLSDQLIDAVKDCHEEIDSIEEALGGVLDLQSVKAECSK